MWSGGPNPAGSSASRSEKIPFVSSELALTVIAKGPRSIDLPSPGPSTYASPAAAIAIASESGVRATLPQGRPLLVDNAVALLQRRLGGAQRLALHAAKNRPEVPS